MANFDDIFTAPAEQKKEQNEQKKPRRNNRGRMNPDEWAAKKKAERLAAYELADKTTGEIFADGNRFSFSLMQWVSVYISPPNEPTAAARSTVRLNGALSSVSTKSTVQKSRNPIRS